MRRLFRLVLPLGIMAIMLAAPTGAGAQVTTTYDFNGVTGLKVDDSCPVADDPSTPAVEHSPCVPAFSSPTTGRQNSDLAFWGNTLVQGDSRGIRVFDITNPTAPVLKSDFPCNGAYGDVSIWGTLVFRSVDRPQTTAGCGSADTAQTFTAANLGAAATATAQATDQAPGFEGIQIIDISDPTAPAFVAGVATDCGSFSHTLVPDTANNRVLLYVSSFPNAALSGTPTGFGNTCVRLASGAPPNAVSGHDKISIVEVPLAAPATASVVNEVDLGAATDEYDEFFSWIPDYAGGFSNEPGYEGCHDIAVYMPAHLAAAACITNGLLLDISDPESPTVTETFVNPAIDRCAQGVFHLSANSSTTAAGPNNCMWSTAAFSYDGKRVMFGDLSSGFNRCRGNIEIPSSCGIPGSSVNAGADRFYDGTSVTNECDIGTSNANPRDTYDRGAYWLYDVGDPSWPLSSAKPQTSRYVRQANQGCSSRLGGFIPAVGTYQTTGAWGLAGMDVTSWDDLTDTQQTAWYQVRTCTVDATCTTASTGGQNDGARSHAAAAYWYNGHVFVSYDSPMYAGWAPTGSRGLEVFTYSDPSVAKSFKLARLNPQTVEQALKCSVSISGTPRVGRQSNLNATVRVLGQALSGVSVRRTGGGLVAASKTTNGQGKVTFSVTPRNRTPLKLTVANDENLLGCSASKSVLRRLSSR